MSIKLRLEGAEDVLDLNGIAESGIGFQAIKGANIFGLPPVTPQWSEGAGDGAVFRGRRVRSRDGDLPLDILGRDRSHLKELLARLSKVLASPAKLVAQEPDGSEWYTTVVRTAGGGYQYGIDSTGENDMQLVISLTAPDPYFTSSKVSTQRVLSNSAGAFLSNLVSLEVSPSQAIGSITIENTGDATTYPVWTVYGPGRDFKAVSQNGETLWWTGTLGVDEVLTLDTRTGTAHDQSGFNRYGLLATAPKFWSVQPGITTSEASLLDTNPNSKIVCSWQARKWMVV